MSKMPKMKCCPFPVPRCRLSKGCLTGNRQLATGSVPHLEQFFHPPASAINFIDQFEEAVDLNSSLEVRAGLAFSRRSIT
jgi:hypothetical protein